jgi:hypothetical protein
MNFPSKCSPHCRWTPDARDPSKFRCLEHGGKFPCPKACGHLDCFETRGKSSCAECGNEITSSPTWTKRGLIHSTCEGGTNGKL